VDCVGQGPHGADFQAVHDARFGGVRWRQQQALQPETTGGDRNRQHAADAVDGSVEREFAQDDGVLDGPSP